MAITHFLTMDPTEAAAASQNMNASADGNLFYAFPSLDTLYAPMYRANRPSTGAHILTTYIDERDVAVNEWQYEGEQIAFWCLPPSAVDQPNLPPNTTTLYRFYNPQTDDYLFSLNQKEVTWPWRPAVVACLIFSQKAADMHPLLRYRSKHSAQHFITAQPELETDLTDWTFESTLGYVYIEPQGVLTPFFRSYNATGGHFYTISMQEHNESRPNGYRADGLLGYVWAVEPPGGASALFRSYNPLLEDHVYSIGEPIIGHGYLPQGTIPAAWVVSPATAPVPNTQGVQQFKGNFVEDFFLSPTLTLEGASNFFVTSFYGNKWNAVMDLMIDIEITADLTVQSVDQKDLGLGMSIQLNGYSPKGWNSQWQQYCLTQSGSAIGDEVQNWVFTNDHTYTTGFVEGSVASIASLPTNTLPAGYHLRIALENDEFGNVLGATFVIIDKNGKPTSDTQTIANFKWGKAFGSAPILGFQVVFVGPGSGSGATFAAGGAGTISYSASTPLFARGVRPGPFSSVLAWWEGTGESSNMTYSQVASTKINLLTQTFSV